jgi:uncharacterized coiled-coil protein SlyX
MAILQFRRGTTFTDPQIAEPFLDTTNNNLLVGVSGSSYITLAALGTEVSGNILIAGDISASGNITSSQLYVENIISASNLYLENDATIQGNIILGGTIYLGDGSGSDTIIVNASLSGSLVPDTDNEYTLGTQSKRYSESYIVSGSFNNLTSTNISGSIEGIGNVSQFSQSVDSRIDYLEGTFSQSISSSFDELLITSSNQESRIDFIETTFSSSVDSRLDLIENFSSSQYLTDSASFDTRLDQLETDSGSQENRIQNLELTGSNHETRIGEIETTFSSSVDLRLTKSESTSSNHETRIDEIETTFSSSVDFRLFNLEITGSEQENRLGNIELFSSSQEIFNSSLATTGSNIFQGNEEITGSLRTTGSVHFQLGSIGSNNFAQFAINQILLSSTGITSIGVAPDGGPRSAVLRNQKDANDLSGSTTGSWYGTVLEIGKIKTQDIFIGGNTDTELTTKQFTVTSYNTSISGALEVSGSFTSPIQEGYYLVGDSSGFSSQLPTSSFTNRIDDLESTGSNQENRIVDLESTGSDHETRIDEIETTFSSSVDSRLDEIETTFSTSVDLRLDDLELTGSDHEQRLTDFETNSGSYARIDTTNTFTELQTFDNIEVLGTASFGYIQSITGSAKIIGDAFIILNNNLPGEPYAGIRVIDSGSTDTTASLIWDGERDHWVYQLSSGSTYSGGGFLSGPRLPSGSDISQIVYPTQNYILKGDGGDHVSSSRIFDDGVQVKVETSLNVIGAVTGSTFVGAAKTLNFGGTTLLSSSVNFTTYTGSVDSKFNTLQTVTSSFNSRLNNLELDSSSQDSRLDNVELTTQSFDGRLDNIELTTQSFDGRLDSLETFTSSQETKNTTLQTTTASYESRLGQLETDSGSQNTRIVDLESASSSFENRINEIETTFSSSVDLRLDQLESDSGSQDSRLSNIELTTQSFDGRLDNIELTTQSFETRISQLESDSGSQDSRLSNIELTTQSFDERLDQIELTTQSLDLRLDELETFSQSLDTRYEEIASGTHTLVSGSSQINITGSIDYEQNIKARIDFYTQSLGDAINYYVSNSIVDGNPDVLANAGAIKNYIDAQFLEAGEISEIVAGNGLSGGGSSGSLTLTLDTGSNHFVDSVKNKLNIELVISSSDQLTASFDARYGNELGDGLISSSDQLTSSLDLRYLEVNGDNVVTSSAQILNGSTILSSSNENFSTFSSSVDLRLDNAESANSSGNDRLNALESFSSSLEGDFVTQIELADATGALENSIATKLDTGSYNTDSSSFDLRIDNLESFSSSLEGGYVNQTELADATGALENSIGTKLDTGSYNIDSASFDVRLDNVETFTSSQELKNTTLETVTSSLDNRLDNVETWTGSTYVNDSQSFDSRLDVIETTFSSSVDFRLDLLEVFTGSQTLKNATLELTTASFDNRITQLESDSGSQDNRLDNLELFTSSQQTKNSTLGTYTSSVDNKFTSVGYSTSSLNSFTSSQELKNTTLETVTSSLDSRLDNVELTTASFASRLGQLETNSGSQDGKLVNLEAFTSSQQLKNTTLETVTSSLDGRLDNIEIITSSFIGRLNNIEIITQSLDGRVDNIELFTSSQETKNSTLSNYTSSINTKFTAVGVATQSLDQRLDSFEAVSASYARTDVNNNFGGIQTFNDISVNGTASFAYIQSTTGSAKIIGDAFIVLNNNTPSERYAGLLVIDSGSNPSTASFFFDGQTNDWNYEYSGSGGIDYGVAIFGPEYNTKGSPTYLTDNRIPKAVDNHHLNDSNITDTGTLITLGSNSVVQGTFYATGTTLVSSSTQTISHLGGTNIVSASTDTTNVDITITNGNISANLKGGVVSGSSQIDAASTTNWTTNVKTRLNAETVISGSSQVAINSTTGTLAVNKGGTGATSLTSNAVLTGNGTSAIQAETNLTFDGNILTVNTNELYVSGSRVGFGTSLPQSAVHISGSTTVLTISPTTHTGTAIGNKGSGISLLANSTTATNGGEIVWATGDTAQRRWAAISGDIQSNSQATGARGNIIFATKTNVTDTTLTERMRINYDGNVGIGTPSVNPPQKLTVNGSISGSDNLYIEDDAIIGGNVYATGDVVAYYSSDIRLKDNITPISSPLEKINKLSGNSFEWNEEKQHIYKGKDYGVIAQEVQEIFPELVHKRENGYLGVKYEKLVAVLIEGIKELSREVEELKSKLESK